MKVGFDAKRFFNNFTGLGNYSRFVIGALSENIPENEYFLYSPKVKNHAELSAILDRPNIRIVKAPSIYSNLKATSLWRTWGISKEESVKKLDVFHGLSQELPVNLPARVKKIVTVHDLIFIRYPELYNPLDVFIYKAKVRAACRQADKILATSIQTKSDIVDFLHVDHEKIDVVYQGCHPSFKRKYSAPEIEKAKTKYGLPEHYILNVGTIEERKNVLLLVRAFSMLPQELKVHVVIIGRATKYKARIMEAAQRARVSERVKFLHDVSFVDLPAIYQGAQVFVYPSKFEGFGIPIVEALESSVPVIAATGSCLREAGGPGSIYVDPNDAQALAAQIQNVLHDEVLRSKLVSEGTKYMERFQPATIAKQLAYIYSQ